MKACFASCATLLLAACGGQPTRPIGETQPPDAASAATPEKPAIGRGGYYLDDGPDDNPPPNLDSIPDAEPKPEPLHRFANSPYAVFGQEYVPDQKLKPYRKRGLASWYGRRFNGQNTSSGDRYDMYAMTAAHATLPIPSYARVTNLANGRSVVVRINDRGPFHAGRIIDLSYTAAYKLGFVNNGSALVEVQNIIPGETTMTQAKPGARVSDALTKKSVTLAAFKPAEKAPAPVMPLPAPAAQERDPIAELAAAMEERQSKPPVLPAVSDTNGIFLQLAAFSSSDSAESFRAHLLKELAWLSENILIRPKNGLFRLHLGPYSSPRDAMRIAERIREALELKPFVVQR
jgi:peptidoglycan lytic transglycosylase